MTGPGARAANRTAAAVGGLPGRARRDRGRGPDAHPPAARRRRSGAGVRAAGRRRLDGPDAAGAVHCRSRVPHRAARGRRRVARRHALRRAGRARTACISGSENASRHCPAWCRSARSIICRSRETCGPSATPSKGGRHPLPAIAGRPSTGSSIRATSRPSACRCVEGRDFSDADRAGAMPVAVVNQSMAERRWPGESAGRPPHPAPRPRQQRAPADDHRRRRQRASARLDRAAR